ncbi:hypothetical protein NWQ34_05970 [Mycoplasmopsis felis]|uniref:hypothetical protein n=1 Tax=Mycoplasmopsis felis TaxID=33923 RepID=UPI0021DF50E6|nr:hypothetical protein [Mycoplasmopsis felis]MCU9939094.1 hypothetical protein [Mycoplasmopsis felis]
MRILKSKLYDIEIQKKQQEESEFRKLAGSGARAEKFAHTIIPKIELQTIEYHFQLH